MEWFISDTHFDHKNIMEFESNTRGHFSSVEEMNEEIIKNWNNTVSVNDTVYHLGDFGMNTKYDRFKELVLLLNGNIVLIQGNHDDSKVVKKLAAEGLIELHEVGMKLKRDKQVMWLSHYPMEIGVRPRKWSVSGHIHSEPSKDVNQLNVGIDSDFMKVKKLGQPCSMNELIGYMNWMTSGIEVLYKIEREGES